jgi:hypothetical protein
MTALVIMRGLCLFIACNYIACSSEIESAIEP